jgi:small subunit ribosomal protein S8
MKDSIADFITQIKNAGGAGKSLVVAPFSTMKMAIAELLIKEGFLKSAVKKGKKIAKFIEAEVMYDGNTPRVQGVKRISKLSRRIYQGASDIKPVRYGYGIVVMSTPKGIMTGRDARKQNLGGEVLFNIW